MARRKGRRKNPRFGKRPKTYKGFVRRWGVKEGAKKWRKKGGKKRKASRKKYRKNPAPKRRRRKAKATKRRYRRNTWKGQPRKHAKAARKGWRRKRRKASHRRNPAPKRRRRRARGRKRSYRRNPAPKRRRRGGRRRAARRRYRRNPGARGFLAMLKSLIPSTNEMVTAGSLAGSMLAVELFAIPAMEKIGARQYIQKLGLPSGLGEQAAFTAGLTLLCGFIPHKLAKAACKYAFLGGLTAIAKNLMVQQLLLSGRAGADAKEFAEKAGYKPMSDFVTFRDYVTLRGEGEDAGALDWSESSIEPGDGAEELADYYGVTAF